MLTLLFNQAPVVIPIPPIVVGGTGGGRRVVYGGIVEHRQPEEHRAPVRRAVEAVSHAAEALEARTARLEKKRAEIALAEFEEEELARQEHEIAQLRLAERKAAALLEARRRSLERVLLSAGLLAAEALRVSHLAEQDARIMARKTMLERDEDEAMALILIAAGAEESLTFH